MHSEAIRGHQRHLEASRGRFVWVPTPQARARSCSGSYGLGCTRRDPYLCSSLPILLARPSQLCSCSAHGRWLIGEPIALRVPGAIPLTGAPVKEGTRPRVVSTRRSKQKGKARFGRLGRTLDVTNRLPSLTVVTQPMSPSVAASPSSASSSSVLTRVERVGLMVSLITGAAANVAGGERERGAGWTVTDL